MKLPSTWHPLEHQVVLLILNGRQETITHRAKWCYENVGASPISWNWFPDWASNQVTFSFRDPQDATLFALRWA
jgi:hypothetical protein